MWLSIAKVKIQVEGFKCKRCGHEWIPRGEEEPSVCPNCNMVMIKFNDLPEYSMDGYLYKNLIDAQRIVETKNQSFIFCNDGKSGLGKTTLSFQEAFLLARGDKKKFNIGHVLYDPLESFNLIANSKKGDVWSFDEATIFNNRSAMSRYNKQMMLLLDTIRSKQIYIIINLPSIFNLDSAITLDKVHLLIHLYGDHFGDKGKFMAFDDRRLQKIILFGKKARNYNVVKSNFFGSFGKEFLLDETFYDSKKNDAIKKMMDSQDKGLSYIQRKHTAQRDWLLAVLTKRDKYSHKEIEQFLPKELTMTPADISKAVAKAMHKYSDKCKELGIQFKTIDY